MEVVNGDEDQSWGHAARAEDPHPFAASAAAPLAGEAPILVWLRNDLRLADNAALHAAARSGAPVLPVFIYAPAEEGPWPLGDAARYWLHHSLGALRHDLRKQFGSELLLRSAVTPGGLTTSEPNASICAAHPGGSVEAEVLEFGSANVLVALARETGACACYWNRCYEPWSLARDEAVVNALRRSGVVSRQFVGNVLREPWAVKPDERAVALTAGFGTYASWAAALAELEEEEAARVPDANRADGEEATADGRNAVPLPPPSSLPGPRDGFPRSVPLASFGLACPPAQHADGAPPAEWMRGVRRAWAVGEAAAQAELARFTAASDGNPLGGLGGYDSRERHRADKDGSTSRLSPHVRFGELSVRQILAAARESATMRCMEGSGNSNFEKAVGALERRLAWRDMAYWALWRYPPARRVPPFPAAGPPPPSAAPSSPAAAGAPAAAATAAAGTQLPVAEAEEEPQRTAAPRWSEWGWIESAADPMVGFRAQYADEAWAGCAGDSSGGGGGDGSPLRAWQCGQTGYPLVDAAMRQLATQGWMPNYLRHVTAQFLVEFLRVDWREGMRWFARRLLDGDAAVNSFMWQNGGHAGLDQWCFVMHPVAAAATCDPEGAYVRTHVPELAGLPAACVHCPWLADESTLGRAAMTALAATYPQRAVVDLEAARAAGLAAVLSVRERHRASLVAPVSGRDVFELRGVRYELVTRNEFRTPFLHHGTKCRAQSKQQPSRTGREGSGLAGAGAGGKHRKAGGPAEAVGSLAESTALQ